MLFAANAVLVVISRRVRIVVGLVDNFISFQFFSSLLWVYSIDAQVVCVLLWQNAAGVV